MNGVGSGLLQTYTDNYTSLLRYARRLNSGNSGNGHIAEDILQDAYLRISSSSQATFETKSDKSRLNYLFQVVHNLSVDYYRKQTMIDKYFSSASVEYEMAISPGSPETHCSDIEILSQITDALAELPERTRYAFEKHRVHGIPQKDIAEELGVSRTLVNFMIRDAMVHCRKRLRRLEAH